MTEKTEALIAEARTIAKHSAVSLPDHADCLTRLADALEARQPSEGDREAIAKQLRDIGAVRKVDQDCSCEDCEATTEWVNAPLGVVLDLVPRAAAPDAASELRAERDAALAAIERVRAIAERHGVKSWTEEIFAALDGAPEPEWEYGAKVYNSGRVVRIEDSPEKVQLGMSAISYANPQWVDDVLVRRRPAGPWLPVEGEN